MNCQRESLFIITAVYILNAYPYRVVAFLVRGRNPGEPAGSGINGQSIYGCHQDEYEGIAVLVKCRDVVGIEIRITVKTIR